MNYYGSCQLACRRNDTDKEILGVRGRCASEINYWRSLIVITANSRCVEPCCQLSDKEARRVAARQATRPSTWLCAFEMQQITMTEMRTEADRLQFPLLRARRCTAALPPNPQASHRGRANPAPRLQKPPETPPRATVTLRYRLTNKDATSLRN